MSESDIKAAIEVQCTSCSSKFVFELAKEEIQCPHCSTMMPREAAILDFLRTVMSETFQFNRDEIHPDSQLREIGDSLGTIEVLMKLEREFNIMIEHEDIEELETVQAVAKYIDGRLAAS